MPLQMRLHAHNSLLGRRRRLQRVPVRRCRRRNGQLQRQQQRPARVAHRPLHQLAHRRLHDARRRLLQCSSAGSGCVRRLRGDHARLGDAGDYDARCASAGVRACTEVRGALLIACAVLRVLINDRTGRCMTPCR
jgi:hypothetical protein